MRHNWDCGVIRIGSAKSTPVKTWREGYDEALRLSATFPNAQVSLDYVGAGNFHGQCMCREFFRGGKPEPRTENYGLIPAGMPRFT